LRQRGFEGLLASMSRLLWTLPACALAGCATLTAPRMELLQVNSLPPGAEVRADGVPVGTTPVAVPISRTHPTQVEVRAPGHEPVECPVHLVPGPGYLAADIVLCVLFFPVGCVSFLDAAGAWNVLARSSCEATLTPLAGPPVVMPPPPLPTPPVVPGP
jgi:hypothetical protein